MLANRLRQHNDDARAAALARTRLLYMSHVYDEDNIKVSLCLLLLLLVCCFLV